MNAAVLHELAERWGTVYDLRHITATNSYRGIVDGVCVEVTVADQMLLSHFFSPTASLVSQIATDFAGFQHTANGGVALQSLRGILSNRKDDLGSCVLELQVAQLLALGPEKFDEILRLVAKDFSELGADPDKLNCELCQTPYPSQLVQYDGQYHVTCKKCLETLQLRAMENPQAVPTTTVNWNKAVPTMLLVTVIMGVAWGLLQHPSLRLPFYLLVVLPAFGVLTCFRSVAVAAGGMNGRLKAAMIASTLSAILIGNVIGYGFALAEFQVNATWFQIIRAYFEVRLPTDWFEESFFFFGGLAGIYFALRIFKPKTQGEILKQL